MYGLGVELVTYSYLGWQSSQRYLSGRLLGVTVIHSTCCHTLHRGGRREEMGGVSNGG